MIVTLTGANTFLLGQEQKRLVSEFVSEQGDLALERLDGEEASFSRLREALTSLPFLATKKMVVMRAPGANKQFVEKVEQLFGEIPETTDVILIEPKLDKRSVYYKFLKKTTDFHEYNELDVNGLAEWLAGVAKQQGGALSQSDARYLIERTSTSQQALQNELDKLLLYEPKITRQTVDLLTEATPQSTIFQLLEAAFAGNAQRAIELYAEQRALKVEPAQLIAMLVWQLHVLVIIKTAGERSPDQIAGEAKLNPFVVRKSLTVARQLTLKQLKSEVTDLLAIDTRSKRQAIDLDEALQHYLLSLTQ